jgi:hypothetical protein
MTREAVVMTSGYTTATRLLLVVVGVAGSSLIGYSFMTRSSQVDGITAIGGLGLFVVWFGAALDGFLRRIWVHTDRLVYRNMMGLRSEYLMREFTALRRGQDRLVIEMTDGRHLTILARMQNYELLVAHLARKSALALSRSE